MLHKLISWLSTNFAAKNQLSSDINTVASATTDALQKLSPCCSAKVHIAYRGVSDDRLYLAYDRNFSEVKFFRPTNLRVYCQRCRKRIYRIESPIF